MAESLRALALLRLAVPFAAVAALSACASVAASSNKLPNACGGIPGDPQNPSTELTPPPATHGPGASGVPIRLAATGGFPVKQFRPPPSIPMLYVYNDEGGFALNLFKSTTALDGPLFKDVAKYAFWTEVADGHFYELPWFSSCDQTLLLGNDFSFKAPKGGLLFVQYRTDDCKDCDRLTQAINTTLAEHSTSPARWVQYDLGSIRGGWCQSGFGFISRANISESNKDFVCRR